VGGFDQVLRTKQHVIGLGNVAHDCDQDLQVLAKVIQRSHLGRKILEFCCRSDVVAKGVKPDITQCGQHRPTHAAASGDTNSCELHPKSSKSPARRCGRGG